MNRILCGTALLAILSSPVMAQDAFVLDDIVFSAGLTPLEAARAGVVVGVIDEEELRAAGEVPLPDLLATVPGVSFTRNGPPGTSTSLRIRGAGQGLIAVYIDGIAVNDPTSTSGQFNGFDSLTTGAVRRVEILRGSQSSIFGTNAVAGVVSITTVATEDAPEGTTQTVALEAGSYATASASYGLTQREGPLTLSFGLTHSRTDGFSAAEEDAGNTETDPSDATLLSLGAIYEVTPELTIGANAFLETTNSEFDEFVGIAPGDGTPGDETASTHTMGFRIFAEYEGLTWSHRLSATHLAVERELASASVASIFASPYASSFEGTTTGLQYLATTEALANTVLSFGADWQEDEGSFTGLSGGTRTLSTTGVFGEAVWTAMPGLDILLSARHEENETFGGVTTGRLAASYQLDGATTLRGAIATGYRAPVLSELYGTFPLSGGQFFFGNPNLQPEESVSYEIGIDHAYAGGAEVSATLFRLEVDNFIQYQDCTRDAFFVCTTSATNANVPGVSTFQGVELSGLMPLWEGATLTGAYTYTDAKQASGARVIRVPRHDLALGLDADLGNGWGNRTTLRAVSDIVDSGSVALQDYVTVDTTISYRFDNRMETYLRVENLFDEDYQTVRGYGTSDRAFYLGLRARF
jgi:vitamin B12 transporter